MSATVPVRFNAEVNGEAFVDEADLPLVADTRWYFTSGYVCAGSRDKRVYMHRLILGLVKGDGKIVDHVNGNPLDNRRDNLRLCTHAENNHNKRRGLGGRTSRFRGVSLAPDGQNWVAKVCLGRKATRLGTFSDEVEAARAVARFNAEHRPFAIDPALEELEQAA